MYDGEGEAEEVRREGAQCPRPAPPQQQEREDGDAEQVGVHEHVPQQEEGRHAVMVPRERFAKAPEPDIGEDAQQGWDAIHRAAENAPRQEEDRPQQHERPPDLAPVHASPSLRPAGPAWRILGT